MDETGGGVRRAAVVAGTLVACVAATLAVWWPTLGIGFLGDDLEGVARAAGSTDAGSGAAPLYRPLALWSLHLDRDLWGLDPRGFHLTGLLLAAVAAWLVGAVAFGLGRRWPPVGSGAPRPWVAAAAAAGWFVLWPSHAEAVAWIGGRGDLIAVVGCLTCLWCWGAAEGWWSDRLRDDDRAARSALAWRVLSVVAIVTALAGKESAVVWPLVVAVLAAALAGPDRARGRVRAAVLRVWPLVAAAVVWFVWRSTRLVAASGGPPPAWEGAPWGPVRRLASVVVRAAVPPLDGRGLVAVGAVAVLLGAGAAVIRRSGGEAWRLPAALVAAAAISALPGTALGASADGSIGERLTFLASVPVVLLCALALLAVWSTRAAWGVAAAVLVTAALVPSTVAAVHRWTRAGDQAARFVASLDRLPRDRPVVLLVLPDERGGAYVARNALTAELAERRGWRSPQLVWAATSARADGALEVSTAAMPAPADGTGTWRVRLGGAGARFTEVSPRPAGPDAGAVAVRRVDPAEVEVAVGPSLDGVPPEVWTLDGGRVVPAPRAPR
ncbi:MAG: hypothetical protein ACOYOP_11195 [Microthrixaceae bacterium]